MFRLYQQTPAWEDVPWIRERCDGPLVVKGILTVEDARRAVDEGADAIVISNHGGNVLDGSVPTLPVLPEIAEAVGDVIEVLVDSGVRQMLELFRQQIDEALAFLGVESIDELDPSFLELPPSWALRARALELIRTRAGRRARGAVASVKRRTRLRARVRVWIATATPTSSRTGAELAYERRDARTKVHAVDTRLKTSTIHLTPCETLSDRRLGVGKHMV